MSFQSHSVITLRNVTKYYKLYNHPKDRLKEALSPSGKRYHRKFYALKHIDLDIKEGEIVGIVGRNGSGKSTLLKLITGVLRPDEGSLETRGNISALLELGSGFNPEFTGIQNIFFYGTILGFSREEMEEKLDDILDFADIGEFAHQPLKTYSSGMKSRLGFAVAVHVNPDILILDEVLAVGDVLFRRKCYQKMEEFFKSGKTILYVSHDTNSIKELCRRAVFLDRGEILMDGKAEDVAVYYEKFLFAKEENREAIRREIRTGQTVKKVVPSTPHTVVKKMETQHKKSVRTAYFLPDFKPLSTVVYQNENVYIENIRIEDENGRKVNVLVQDERYHYRYTIRFGLDAQKVSFGTQIKTEKGLRISGAALHHADACIDVRKNEIYEVDYVFTCRLLEGVYYTNTGVSAIVENERVFLNRIVDAYIFKVLPKPNSLYAGLVHLDQQILFTRKGKTDGRKP